MRQLLGRAAETEGRGVFILKHCGVDFDFNRAAIAGVGLEFPCRGRARLERGQVLKIERGEKSVRVHPDADPLDENMAINRKIRIQIGAKRAVVFGFHAAQIHPQSGHSPPTIG